MASKPLTITLTPELYEFVRSQTAGGDYNSDSEVVRDGLRLLKERDQIVKMAERTGRACLRKTESQSRKRSNP
jgi:putative addiction module CopG family antidote